MLAGIGSGAIGGFAGFERDDLPVMIAGATATGLVSAASGANYVAGFVGYNIGGSVTASSFAGTVLASGGNSNVGGFVGQNQYNGTVAASLANDTASGFVSVAGTGYFIGGFAGYNYSGTASAGSFAGTVLAGSGSSAVGGFAGGNYLGLITGATATGLVGVSGSANNIGGFVGYNNGTVVGDYAYASVSAPNATDVGQVGYNDASGYVSLPTFAAGTIVIPVSVGDYVYMGNGSSNSGLVGYNAGTVVTGTGGFITGITVLGGNLTIADNVSLADPVGLTLSAYNSILVDGNIVDTGTGNIVLRADGAGVGPACWVSVKAW